MGARTTIQSGKPRGLPDDGARLTALPASSARFILSSVGCMDASSSAAGVLFSACSSRCKAASCLSFIGEPVHERREECLGASAENSITGGRYNSFSLKRVYSPHVCATGFSCMVSWFVNSCKGVQAFQGWGRCLHTCKPRYSIHTPTIYALASGRPPCGVAIVRVSGYVRDME